MEEIDLTEIPNFDIIIVYVGLPLFGGEGAFVRCQPDAVLEIERRFLIRMPDVAALLAEGAGLRLIVQTYLVTPSGYSSERVRKSESGGVVTFTHTRKKRIALEAAVEQEREISLAEYEALLSRADPLRRPIEKKRLALAVGDLVYEIDIFPEWRETAILEVELPSAEHPLSIPSGIAVLREITGERRYSNHALSLCFPPEENISQTV